jgi:hypothetical protein
MKYLTEVRDALRAVSTRAETLYATVGAERMSRRPGPKSWSASKCLAHLAISANAYKPVWREVFDLAHKMGVKGTEPYRMDRMGRLLNWSLEPGRFRMQTPARFQPVDAEPPDVSLAAFLDSQNMVLAFVDEGAGLPLNNIRIVSQFNAMVKYNVWSSFVIVATHGRRHLRQAEIAGGLR